MNALNHEVKIIAEQTCTDENGNRSSIIVIDEMGGEPTPQEFEASLRLLRAALAGDE